MKRLFNHTRRPREDWNTRDQGYDWDGEETYTEDGEYYEEETYAEDGEYYEEEAYTEDGVEYYEEEAYEDGGEYYEEGIYESGDAYYEDQTDFSEEDAYYEETGYADVSALGGRRTGRRKRQGILGDILEKFREMGALDRIITATGAAVLVLALVTGGIYVSMSLLDKQVDGFVTVGSQLEDIEVIGEKGLMAVADVRMAKLAAAAAIEEDQKKEYHEAEYSQAVTVKLEMVSVLKDLKIKFTNRDSGKLVANVPFEVTVTKPDGKSETWTDDDMDGIIYKKDIASGTYKVLVNALAGEKYADYTLPTEAKSVEVKKDIDYKKVDVKNEIKKESEVNVAKEDTKKNQTAVESVLQDTVTWVESTSTAVTYREVSKSTIPDPATLARSGSFLRMTASGNDPVPTPTPTPVPTPTPTPAPTAAISLDQTTAAVLTGGVVGITATLDGNATTNVVKAESENEDIATVSVEGSRIYVSGISVGSVTITVIHPDNAEVKAVCTVTVKDSNNKLKDKDGNQLYVLSDEVYREAVYSDYYNADKFFIKGDTKYTGWQTLDGKVYFFDANGDKVTGEQVIQGAKYNFASDGSLVTDSGTMGIDVSKWNGSIDWNAVKNSGVSYVIIRVGYRGSSQGALIDDSKFESNIKGATAAGLKVGVYFFTQAVDEVEAVEEASMVLERIQGYRISYPVFLDVEPSGGRADSISRETRTAVCRAFCETIQNAGYTAGIYANKTWLSEKINTGELGAYKIWLAQYAAAPTYTGRYDLWQYKSTGRISGISGDVDMNISYLGY